MGGQDPNDPTSLTALPVHVMRNLDKGVRGLRIGLDQDYALKGIDSGQAAAIEVALKVLTDLGARVVDVRMPDLTGVIEAWLALCASETLAAHAANYPTRAQEYGPYMREFLELAARITPQQVETARSKRAEFTTQFNAVLESVDAMAGPAGGDPAWPITHTLQVSGSLLEYFGAWSAAAPRSSEFTIPMDVAGVPAICLPSGFSPDGLPYSIQFSGQRLSEPTLCRIAHAYEEATGWHTRHPKVEATG